MKPKTKKKPATVLEMRRLILQWVPLVAGSLVLGLGAIRVWTYPGSEPGILFMGSMSFLMMFVAYLARNGASIKPAALLFLCVIVILLAYAAQFGGGIRAPALTPLILLPIIGFFLAGRNIGLVGMFFAISVILAFFAMQSFGLEIPQELSDNYFFKQAANLVGASIMSFFLGHFYELSFNLYVNNVTNMSQLASMGSLSRGIAHEINNPLSIIFGKIEQIKILSSKGQLETGRILKELETIVVSAERIRDIVSRLQVIAQDGEKNTIRKAALATIVQDVVALLKRRFEYAGIDMRLILDANVTMICKPAQIAHIIIGLLSNAYDAVYAEEKKWVEIMLSETEGHAILRISDSGPTIPKSIAIHMMEPFFTTKKEKNSAGISLSICQAIAHEHGGELYYDNKAANTSFVLSLPIKNSLG